MGEKQTPEEDGNSESSFSNKEKEKQSSEDNEKVKPSPKKENGEELLKRGRFSASDPWEVDDPGGVGEKDKEE